MVWCAICKAAYAPSHRHAPLLQTASLESAFLSMCHFCFRCRRPACPDCWDEVHGICGACVQEVHLPFRTSLAPLGSTSSVPLRTVQSARVYPALSPLVCVCPGCFQMAVSLPIEKLLAEPVEIVTIKTYEDLSEKVVSLPSQKSIGSRRGRIMVISYVLLLLIVVLIIILTVFLQHANVLVTPQSMAC